MWLLVTASERRGLVNMAPRSGGPVTAQLDQPGTVQDFNNATI